MLRGTILIFLTRDGELDCLGKCRPVKELRVRVVKYAWHDR